MPRRKVHKLWLRESPDGVWLCSGCFALGAAASSQSERHARNFLRLGPCLCADDGCTNVNCAGAHARLKVVQARFRTADGPRCRGCLESMTAREREAQLVNRQVVYIRPAAADSSASPSQRLTEEGSQRSRHVLIRVLQLQLCPKASTENIPEYLALRECLKQGMDMGWTRAACMQTFVILQGIRGAKGVQVAAGIMGIGVPCWHVDRYCDKFCDEWLARYQLEVARTGRVAVLGHEEGLAQGLSGHHFVEALRSAEQRANVLMLAEKLRHYSAERFTSEEVLEVKRLINKSQLLLREATATRVAAGLGSSTGYNAMNWTRSFSLLLRDLHGAARVSFSEEMWETMLKCQGGHDVNEALAFFGVESWQAANDVLQCCPDLSWELLFVAICESRQAWQHFMDDGEEFLRIVEAVDAHAAKHGGLIKRLTRLLVQRGVRGNKCFSTRLFVTLKKRLLRNA